MLVLYVGLQCTKLKGILYIISDCMYTVVSHFHCLHCVGFLCEYHSITMTCQPNCRASYVLWKWKSKSPKGLTVSYSINYKCTLYYNVQYAAQQITMIHFWIHVEKRLDSDFLASDMDCTACWNDVKMMCSEGKVTWSEVVLQSFNYTRLYSKLIHTVLYIL